MVGITFRKVVFGAVCLLSGAFLFASGGDTGASASFAQLGAAIAIGLGAAGAAAGQGRAASSVLEGLSRNPSAKDAVFVPLILSLAFMEFQALLAFVIAGKLAGMF